MKFQNQRGFYSKRRVCLTDFKEASLISVDFTASTESLCLTDFKEVSSISVR